MNDGLGINPPGYFGGSFGPLNQRKPGEPSAWDTIPAWAMKAAESISTPLDSHEWDIATHCWPDDVARLLVQTRAAALREAAEKFEIDDCYYTDEVKNSILTLIDKEPS